MAIIPQKKLFAWTELQPLIVSRHCRFFNLTFSKHALNNSIVNKIFQSYPGEIITAP